MRSVCAWVALALVGAGACSVYDSSLLTDTNDASMGGGTSGAAGSTTGGSSGGGSGGAAGTTSGCQSAVPPDPPASSGDPGSIDFVVAVRNVDFGDREVEAGAPNYPLLGYDLDAKCTCFGGTSNSCFAPSWATASNCDGPGGRDNATGALIYDIRKNYFSNFGTDWWNADIEAGSWSLLFRVRNYNGQPDDEQVDLIWYVPDNLSAATGQPPTWNGADEWPIISECLVPQPVDAGSSDAGPEYAYSLDLPKFVDTKAYVAGGVLVASLPDSVITLSESISVRLTAAFVTAKVVDDGGTWRLREGLIAARWKASDILAQLSQFKDPITQNPLCTDSLLYPKFKEKMCSYVDIFAGLSTPTTPCDSLSIGAGFDSHPAKLGAIVKLVPDPPACSPSVDPANDTCDSLADGG